MMNDLSRKPLNGFSAILLLIVACVSLGFGVVHPLFVVLDETKTALVRERGMASKLRSRIAKMETELNALPAVYADEPVWDGGSDLAISTELQSTIQRLAINEQVSLKAISLGQPTPFIGRRAVEVRLEAQVPYDQATHFLQALEVHNPAMIVDHATMQLVKGSASTNRQPFIQMRLKIMAPLAAVIKGDIQ